MCVHAKSLQLCLTLCGPVDCTLPVGLLFRPPGDLPNPGIKPTSLMSPALAGGFFTTGANWEALKFV